MQVRLVVPRNGQSFAQNNKNCKVLLQLSKKEPYRSYFILIRFSNIHFLNKPCIELKNLTVFIFRIGDHENYFRGDVLRHEESLSDNFIIKSFIIQHTAL